MRCRVPSRTTTLAAVAAAATLALTGCGGTTDGAAPADPASSTTGAASTTAASTTAAPRTATTTTTVTPSRSAARSSAAPTRSTSSPRTTSPRRSSTPASRSDAAATRLPLNLTTGDATRVVTVVTSGRGDTTGTLRRWQKDGKRWRQVGRAVDAYVGSGGVGSAREGSSKTPAGSFTLTQAFGRNADPGSRLPYVRTTDDDYWISSPGPKYNTRQRCGDCGYDNGVNEHLREIAPEYNYAVVIDYNTRNAPGGVRPGKGSAFFLHVENGEPTAGCVSIPQDRLLDVMRWLRPSTNPRILIGIS